MFTIEIAGIPIAIDNQDEIVEQQCREYLTDKPPLFTVSASEEEMKQEKAITPGYAESICLYREIARRIIAYDAFVMHAAVIDLDGQGIAFTAKSGTGKTTRVQLWQEAMGERVRVVNGDKPILRFTNGQLYAYGTPWMGKERLGANTYVPMKAVCFIERSDTVSLKRLQTAEILSRLFHQVLIPNDAEQLAPFMALMERFIQAVPFFLLRCNRDKENPEAIWDEIQASNTYSNTLQ